ncbi:DNA polymerase lambda [Plakobranchus ocellatus]|uniref:DNA polymerase n=1 Tax=Plakobranchus ocellatus TaxID=259542 RepID=A0AAV4AQS5_9GAST|nr:DNA polymerase lambda [Plakobranchus ocellatus]
MATKRKRSSQSDRDNNCSKKKCSEIDQSCSDDLKSHDFLSTLNVYILPAGIQKARLSVLKAQIMRFGGNIQEVFDPGQNLSHVIVEDSMDLPRIKRILKLDNISDMCIVKTSWISLCLRNKKMEKCDEYSLVEKLDDKQTFPSSTAESFNKKAPEPSTKIDVASDYESSDEDELHGDIAGNKKIMQLKFPQPEKWICAQSSKNPKANVNKYITDKLEEMVKAYESTNDKWRALGYQKAIGTLRKHPKEISSWEEAKSLPGIGARLADKIWEIAQSGELRKLKEFESSEELQVLKLFTNVWGAGPHTAQLWYQQGFRTIADLQQKANLNHQQKVGVRLYDDFLNRMPREEVAEIETMVKDAAESIQLGIIAQTCGSYRRGKPTCGDVDILITHPDGKSHRNVFHKLLAKLKENGFLTDDLVSAEETGNQKKYMGVCKLPGENRKHRRIDIIVVPFNEYGCALVYFTGSAHFNRSLRHLCKKQNMSLNEHALKYGVVRKGAEKIHEGTIIPTPTEESVFKTLNVPFRPPEERDH